MYGEKPLSDAFRVLRAVGTNQLARVAPRLYLRITRQTGRGAAEESPEDIADYFEQCFGEYFEQLGIAPGEREGHLEGKRVLEYGPGDIQGVALLMLAHGARQVYCVDRFPMAALHEKNRRVLELLLARLDGPRRARAEAVFRVPGDPGSGFDPASLVYLIHPRGLSELRGEVDLVYSRAVLEHVNDLEATFQDMATALRPGGRVLHQVDLKSHGYHQRNPLDFLTWPVPLWNAMYGYKGAPNRLRVDQYRRAMAVAGLVLDLLQPTLQVAPEIVAEVRPHLAGPYRGVSDEDLTWLGFWLVGHRA